MVAILDNWINGRLFLSQDKSVWSYSQKSYSTYILTVPNFMLLSSKSQFIHISAGVFYFLLHVLYWWVLIVNVSSKGVAQYSVRSIRSRNLLHRSLGLGAVHSRAQRNQGNMVSLNVSSHFDKVCLLTTVVKNLWHARSIFSYKTPQFRQLKEL